MLLLAAVALVIGCNSESDKKTNDKQADTATTVTPSEKGVKLICTDMGEDSTGTPHYDVYVSVDGMQTKIKSVYACNDIAKESYAQYQIPTDAIAACGGWYAGAGDYYYVILREGKPVVFEGWREEQQEDDGYHWKEISINNRP